MKRYIKYALFALAGILFGIAFIHHRNPIIMDLGTYVFVALGVVLTTFVVVYGRRPWRTNVYGRTLMYSIGSLAAITDSSLINRLVEHSHGQWWPLIRLTLFTGVLLTEGRLLYLLFFGGRNEEVEDDRTE